MTHVVAGLTTTGLSYGLAVGASYLYSDSPGAKELRIPVAGPWLSLAKTRCGEGPGDCNKFTLVLGAIAKVFDGVLQAGGLAVAAEGLFLPTSSAPQRRASRASSTAPSGAADGLRTLRPVPLDFNGRGAGLAVAGAF